MRRLLIPLAVAAVAAGCARSEPPAKSADAAAAPAAATLPDAAGNPARAADVAKDVQRKGPELVAFAEVKPGQKVVDLIPGAGYFTRLFSLTVGPEGKVYALWPDEYDKVSQPDSQVMRKMAAAPPFTNVTVLTQPAKAFAAPEAVDLVFTSQNYHDYPDPFMGKVDPAVLNAAVFKALKPGGLFVIVDHAGRPGTGMTETDTLHRIDVATVKQQVTAAGFVLEGESDLLANPADPRTSDVFDKTIRGRTDQFVLKFRKPK
ncbi:MAG: class I SAM-dependent methyltransferase [Phenylobacterium sp.]|uniref:class I SAM-dependent methyltransferase n=1 Tax=Phenylobacterium sp. TaxID=1871053 RepID=UPI001A5F0DCE|nr:methyltransferase [Phenylobacterium sp.]MBL8554566.1 class I SAM-dependent methyltransferase [Phenylobacterium sp.]